MNGPIKANTENSTSVSKRLENFTGEPFGKIPNTAILIGHITSGGSNLLKIVDKSKDFNQCTISMVIVMLLIIIACKFCFSFLFILFEMIMNFISIIIILLGFVAALIYILTKRKDIKAIVYFTLLIGFTLHTGLAVLLVTFLLMIFSILKEKQDIGNFMYILIHTLSISLLLSFTSNFFIQLIMFFVALIAAILINKILSKTNTNESSNNLASAPKN
jgi:hypothetical protein